VHNARRVMPAAKAQVTLRVDADVLDCIRGAGEEVSDEDERCAAAYAATLREG